MNIMQQHMLFLVALNQTVTQAENNPIPLSYTEFKNWLNTKLPQHKKNYTL